MEKNIFLIVAFFSLLSLVFFFQNYSIVGAYSGIYKVKYISCRYLDFDNTGRCVRIEKQMGSRCDPPNTIYPYDKSYGWGKKGPDWADSWGWFIRPCQKPRQNSR